MGMCLIPGALTHVGGSGWRQNRGAALRQMRNRGSFGALLHEQGHGIGGQEHRDLGTSELGMRPFGGALAVAGKCRGARARRFEIWGRQRLRKRQGSGLVGGFEIWRWWESLGQGW